MSKKQKMVIGCICVLLISVPIIMSILFVRHYYGLLSYQRDGIGTDVTEEIEFTGERIYRVF